MEALREEVMNGGFERRAERLGSDRSGHHQGDCGAIAAFIDRCRGDRALIASIEVARPGPPGLERPLTFAAAGTPRQPLVRQTPVGAFAKSRSHVERALRRERPKRALD